MSRATTALRLGFVERWKLSWGVIAHVTWDLNNLRRVKRDVALVDKGREATLSRRQNGPVVRPQEAI